MTERATCWSVVINNPTDEDRDAINNMPAGWCIEGQGEVGKEGTPHLQLMLKTPQVRFSAVKRHFQRANISAARNPTALKKYVHKEETRSGESIQVKSPIPTLFEYETIVAKMWNEDEFQIRWQTAIRLEKMPDINEVAMKYIDSLVAIDIENGRRGAEFIAINPMWRSAWIKFWRSIIKRNGSQVSSSSGTQVSRASQGGEGKGSCVDDTDDTRGASF